MIDERQVYERLLAAGAPVTWEAERGWCRWAATECIVVGHPEDDTYEAIDLWGDRLAYVTDTDDVVRVVCAHLGLTEPVAETTTGEAAKPLDRVDDVAETVADSPDEATHCACPVCGEDTHDGRVCDPCAHQAVVDERDTLRQQLRDLQEAHELAIAELSRPLAEREAELRAAFGTDDVDGVIVQGEAHHRLRERLHLALDLPNEADWNDDALLEGVYALRHPPESLCAGSPAADGRAVQALLDAHGYPLRELGPVVRVMRLLGQQGVDLAGDAGGDL